MERSTLIANEMILGSAINESVSRLPISTVVLDIETPFGGRSISGGQGCLLPPSCDG